MEFPNIYKGDYKLLALVPITLVIMSIFFIPRVNLGIDFRGGTLITLLTDQDIDAVALETELLSSGMNVREVQQIKSTIGNTVEIELDEDEQLARVEELKGQFYTIFENVSLLEAQYIGTNRTDQELYKEYTTQRRALNSVADELFSISGYTNRASEEENLNLLKKTFTEEYLKIKKDYEEKLDSILKKYVDYTSISVDTVSPTLSSKFIDKAVGVTIISLIFAILLTFAVFRDPIPSVAVLTGALFDVVICIGGMGLFGIPLTLPSFAALLMILGFSLDTDMMLTMKMLKFRRGELSERAYDAMKTGITMSTTDIVAFSSLLMLGVVTNIATYYEIAVVAVMGLIGDLIATWGFNAVIILWYMKTKKIRVNV